MDVNGTRFHLFKGKIDWQRCQEIAENDQPIALNNAQNLDRDWLQTAEGIRLAAKLTLFPRGSRDTSLSPEMRRGAAADRFGNWYWIGHDRRSIYWQPAGSGKAGLYWQADAPDRDTTAEAIKKETGQFVPLTPIGLETVELAGCAVTTYHYLVVGNVSAPGILVFDLYAGGRPQLLRFPAGYDLVPFDLAARPDGGVWILDRINRKYWAFDRYFRVETKPAFVEEILDEAPLDTDFKVVDGDWLIRPTPEFAQGFPIGDDSPPAENAVDPISIVCLYQQPLRDHVLILENGAPSKIHHYYFNEQINDPFSLTVDTTVYDPQQMSEEVSLSVIAHDIAYIAGPNTQPGTGILYTVQRDGNQIIAFNLDLSDDQAILTLRNDYLPLHFFGGRAIVAHPAPAIATVGQVYYDVVAGTAGHDAAVRWLPIQKIEQPRFERQATVETQVLDGRERDCVWHRLFLDACIPAETSVRIWTRAHNDPDLLSTVPFSPEPELYLRVNGAEIPNYQPYAAPVSATNDTGTWELLFQAARGRYLQIRLILAGNGRVSPHIKAMRAYYPRFSYPRNYLPTAYLQDKLSASFLERMLANVEGTYAEIEGGIATAFTLFDARSAPADALDWLAGWLGLMMDPLWAKVREQQAWATATGPASTSQTFDRRRLFIRFARKLFERRGTVSGLHFALQLFLEPCLELMLAQLKRAAVTPDSPTRAHLARFGLDSPTPTTNEAGFEDLLYTYLLIRPSNIRIIESFLTRGGLALEAGDATQVGATAPPAGTEDDLAHRFTVLVPAGLSVEEELMVNRIINLEKPAHTVHTLQRYLDGFRAGSARLGTDTTLAGSPRLKPFMVGRDYILEGYLGAGFPFNVQGRVVSDRDRLGDLPTI
jgi:phage tail-like protein